jgi:hypothetical protein
VRVGLVSRSEARTLNQATMQDNRSLTTKKAYSPTEVQPGSLKNLCYFSSGPNNTPVKIRAF